MRDENVKEMVQMIKDGKGGVVLRELLRYRSRPYEDHYNPIGDYRIFLLALVCRLNVGLHSQLGFSVYLIGHGAFRSGMNIRESRQYKITHRPTRQLSMCLTTGWRCR